MENSHRYQAGIYTLPKNQSTADQLRARAGLGLSSLLPGGIRRFLRTRRPGIIPGLSLPGSLGKSGWPGWGGLPEVLASPRLALKRVPVYTQTMSLALTGPHLPLSSHPRGLPQPRIPLLLHHSQSDPHDAKTQETRLPHSRPQPHAPSAFWPLRDLDSLPGSTPLQSPAWNTVPHRPPPPRAGGRAGGRVSPSRFPAPGGLEPCWKNPSRVPCALRRWGPQHTLR